MHRNQEKISVSGTLVLMLVMLNAFVFEQALSSDTEWYRPLLFTIPLLFFSIIYWRQTS